MQMVQLCKEYRIIVLIAFLMIIVGSDPGFHCKCDIFTLFSAATTLEQI